MDIHKNGIVRAGPYSRRRNLSQEAVESKLNGVLALYRPVVRNRFDAWAEEIAYDR